MKNATKQLLIGVAVISLIFTVFISAFAILINLGWQIFISGPFEVTALSYWQALGIAAMSAILIIPWYACIGAWNMLKFQTKNKP